MGKAHVHIASAVSNVTLTFWRTQWGMHLLVVRPHLVNAWTVHVASKAASDAVRRCGHTKEKHWMPCRARWWWRQDQQMMTGRGSRKCGGMMSTQGDVIACSVGVQGAGHETDYDQLEAVQGELHGDI